MLEAYLAYALIPLFLLILFGLIYFVLIRPNVSAANNSTTAKPPSKTPAKTRADSEPDEKMI